MRKLLLDYHHTPATTNTAKEKVAEATKDTQPAVPVRIDRFAIEDSRLGLVSVANELEGASLPSINELLRAYGKFDVAAGTFSVYSTWQIIVRLVSNAFVKAILPGFEREYEAVSKRR